MKAKPTSWGVALTTYEKTATQILKRRPFKTVLKVESVL